MASSKTVLSILLLASSALAYPSRHLSRDLGAFGTCTQADNKGLSDWYSNDLDEGEKQPTDPSAAYTCIKSGNKDDFPQKDKWVSFNEMWKINQPVMQIAGSSKEETEWIRKAVTTVSNQTAVDARIILAEIMQESTGNVHVKCGTDGSGDHCGLMQAGHGSRSFDSDHGYDSVLNMIQDGVCGINNQRSASALGKPGLLHYLNGGSLMNWINQDLFGNPYTGARMYNSGNVEKNNLNVSPYDPRTKAYVNDISSRLLGWNGGFSGCQKSIACGLRGEDDCA